MPVSNVEEIKELPKDADILSSAPDFLVRSLRTEPLTSEHSVFRKGLPKLGHGLEGFNKAKDGDVGYVDRFGRFNSLSNINASFPPTRLYDEKSLSVHRMKSNEITDDLPGSGRMLGNLRSILPRFTRALHSLKRGMRKRSDHVSVG